MVFSWCQAEPSSYSMQHNVYLENQQINDCQVRPEYWRDTSSKINKVESHFRESQWQKSDLSNKNQNLEVNVSPTCQDVKMNSWINVCLNPVSGKASVILRLVQLSQAGLFKWLVMMKQTNKNHTWSSTQSTMIFNIKNIWNTSIKFGFCTVSSTGFFFFFFNCMLPKSSSLAARKVTYL